MGRTVLGGDGAALCTDELGRIELLALPSVGGVVDLHNFGAVLSPPEVRFLALKALEVSVDGQGVLYFLVIVLRLTVCNPFVFIQFLMLEPEQSLLLELFLQPGALLQLLAERAIILQLDPLLAERTHAKVKQDSWCEPSNLKPLLEASVVENVATLTLDTGTGFEVLDVADRAEGIFILPVLHLALRTALPQAGQALLFIDVPHAGMPALMDL